MNFPDQSTVIAGQIVSSGVLASGFCSILWRFVKFPLPSEKEEKQQQNLLPVAANEAIKIKVQEKQNRYYCEQYDVGLCAMLCFEFFLVKYRNLRPHILKKPYNNYSLFIGSLKGRSYSLILGQPSSQLALLNSH